MILAVGHRGEPVGHRENTVESFLAAAALGADMVEIDCRLSADGHAVVVHDPTLERLWGVPRPVAELSWEEIAAVGEGDPGDGTPRIPDLATVLAEVALPMMVDLPEPAAVP
ncbi:MAG: glycerophosphodiester phosphodiesterase, partial [Acidimicrobiales bacterium]